MKRTAIVILLLVALVCGGGYIYLNRESEIVSPIPQSPSFEIIYMTPTPTVVENVSTPSATPRIGKVVSPTPTKKATPTVSSSSPTPTKKPTASPTP